MHLMIARSTHAKVNRKREERGKEISDTHTRGGESPSKGGEPGTELPEISFFTKT